MQHSAVIISSSPVHAPRAIFYHTRKRRVGRKREIFSPYIQIACNNNLWIDIWTGLRSFRGTALYQACFPSLYILCKPLRSIKRCSIDFQVKLRISTDGNLFAATKTWWPWAQLRTHSSDRNPEFSLIFLTPSDFELQETANFMNIVCWIFRGFLLLYKLFYVPPRFFAVR